MAIGAGHLLGETPLTIRIVLVEANEFDDDDTFRAAKCCLDGIGESLLLTFLHLEAVDDDVDVVLDLLLQLRWVSQSVDLAVHPDAGIALGSKLFEEVDELSLAGTHNRCEYLELGAGFHGHDLVHDFLRGLPLDHFATRRAVRGAGAGEEQAQVVENLGHGAHSGPWVVVGRLLVDGDRR